MPGIVIGDIGAKMGRHGIDNGWIQVRQRVFLKSTTLADQLTALLVHACSGSSLAHVDETRQGQTRWHSH